MTIIHRIGALVLLLTGLITSRVTASPVVEQATSIDWTVAESGRLHALFNSAASVTAFVNGLLGNQYVLASVGEFKLIDMNNDQRLELICTVDYSGRGFYSTVLAFSKTQASIVKSEVLTGGANISGLDARLVDLKHDGRRELLITRLLDRYAGADPVATFTDVYVFHDGVLELSDSRFRSYYSNQRLPSLMTRLGQLKSEGGTAENAKMIDALQKEVDTIREMLSR